MLEREEVNTTLVQDEEEELLNAYYEELDWLLGIY